MLVSFLVSAGAPASRRCSFSAWSGAHSCAGFTLIEALIALAVLVIALATIVPSYGRFIMELELRNAADALAEAMALARAEAIKHGGRANLCKTTDRRTCTSAGGWDAGWLLYLDDNRNGVLDADEAVLRIEPKARLGIRARGNQPVANYVSFTPLGHARLLSGALQMGTFTVCRPGLNAYQVVLANTGRVRVERAAEMCP